MTHRSQRARNSFRTDLQHLPPDRVTGTRPDPGDVFGSRWSCRTAAVTADEAYIRESIVNPQAKVVAGFQPLMPTFQGLVSEEQLLQLIAYVKSLSSRGSSGLRSGIANDAAVERTYRGGEAMTTSIT